eukprot:NODE_624_length_5307_cov_0.437980.p4 type:complete len:101 gc:universal NODE_624_length_5307_cov_0.437980:2086-1784(-)
MDDTIAAIIEACACPLSIVIVGVGPADFAKMAVLDGDIKPISINGKSATRDIVQFVAMRDFTSYDQILTQLPAQLLAEIPNQLVEYMSLNELSPLREPSQ